MASIRGIKKDVDYLTGAVISDCYTYLYLTQEENRERVVEIIEDIVKSRNEFFHLVNNPDKEADRKQKKQYFRKIFTDFIGTVDGSFERLSKLVG